MRKISSMKTAATTPTVVLASGNAEAKRLLAGKTLLQVGSVNDLNDNDITIVTTSNGQNPIKNLSIKIGGTEFLVPFSRSFPMDKLNDADYLLNCEFRQSFVSVKESDGVTPKVDEYGAVVLNETKPYITFGKPSGITIVDREELFAEVSAEQRANS